MEANESGDSTDTTGCEAIPDPETRELERILRRLERLMPVDPALDWKESRKWNIEALGRLAGGCEKSPGLIARLGGLDFEVGGDEHHLIRVDDEPTRIYKATYGDSFGCRTRFDPFDPELSGRNFNATLNDDPRFYLRRWILLNGLGGYRTRYEGILPPERPDWAPRICVSQPWIDAPNPSSQEIERAMLSFGFVLISENSYFQADSRLLLTDAAPRNVKIADGGPVPFDAIAELATGEVLSWIRATHSG